MPNSARQLQIKNHQYRKKATNVGPLSSVHRNQSLHSKKLCRWSSSEVHVGSTSPPLHTIDCSSQQYRGLVGGCSNSDDDAGEGGAEAAREAERAAAARTAAAAAVREAARPRRPVTAGRVSATLLLPLPVQRWPRLPQPSARRRVGSDIARRPMGEQPPPMPGRQVAAAARDPTYCGALRLLDSPAAHCCDADALRGDGRCAATLQCIVGWQRSRCCAQPLRITEQPESARVKKTSNGVEGLEAAAH